jgi:pilus assembly protein Flp/PilA
VDVLKKWLTEILVSDEGVTASEYAIIASLLAIVIITAVGLVGTRLQGLYQTVASNLP